MANFNFNKVILGSRLTADAELKQTPSAVSVTSFSIAVNRKGKEAQTDFIDVVAWRQTAEFVCKYFQKGSPIVVEGSIQTRSYDAQDGSKRYVTEVLVDNAEFVTPKSDGQYSAPPTAYGQQGYPQQSYQQPGYGQQGYGQSAPPQRPEQMRMDTNGFSEVDDDELPF